MIVALPKLMGSATFNILDDEDIKIFADLRADASAWLEKLPEHSWDDSRSLRTRIDEFVVSSSCHLSYFEVSLKCEAYDETVAASIKQFHELKTLVKGFMEIASIDVSRPAKRRRLFWKLPATQRVQQELLVPEQQQEEYGEQQQEQPIRVAHTTIDLDDIEMGGRG